MDHTNDFDKIYSLLESAESAVYWNSSDKGFLETITLHLLSNNVGVKETAHWEEVADHDDLWGDSQYPRCSNCGTEFDIKHKHCPECGAKMSVLTMHPKHKDYNNVVLAVECVIAALAVVAFCGLAALSTLVTSTLARVLLLVVAAISVVAGLFLNMLIEFCVGDYECLACGSVFTPNPREYMSGLQFASRRYLQCPECGATGLYRRTHRP